MDELKTMLRDRRTLRIAVDMWRRIAGGHEAEARRLRAAIEAHKAARDNDQSMIQADKDLWRALDA